MTLKSNLNNNLEHGVLFMLPLKFTKHLFTTGIIFLKLYKNMSYINRLKFGLVSVEMFPINCMIKYVIGERMCLFCKTNDFFKQMEIRRKKSICKKINGM